MLLRQIQAGKAHIKAASAALEAAFATIAAAESIIVLQQGDEEPIPAKASSNPEECEHPKGARRELQTGGGRAVVMCMSCGAEIPDGGSNG